MARQIWRAAARLKAKEKLMPTLPGCLALGGVAVCTWVSFRLGRLSRSRDFSILSS